MHWIPLVIFFIILYFIQVGRKHFNYNHSDDQSENFDCQFPDIIPQTNVVTPPNIPDDYLTVSKTGGGFCKDFADEIVDDHGIYQFPKQRLLYDGVWIDHIKKFGNDMEKRVWNLTKPTATCPSEGVYATNNFLHVEERKFPACEDVVVGESTEMRLPDGCCMDTVDTHGVVYWQGTVGGDIVYP